MITNIKEVNKRIAQAKKQFNQALKSIKEAINLAKSNIVIGEVVFPVSKIAKKRGRKKQTTKGSDVSKAIDRVYDRVQPIKQSGDRGNPVDDPNDRIPCQKVPDSELPDLDDPKPRKRTRKRKEESAEIE